MKKEIISNFIENSTLKVGGNSIKENIGGRIIELSKSIEKWGSSIVKKNRPRLVTNPNGRLVNPFTLVIGFTVDSVEKYQVVIQGDFKEKYKEIDGDLIDLSEDQLFLIIHSNQNSWFKKE
jgi:hypothetical protein